MKVTFFSLTDTGLEREHNEDSFLNNESLGLFLVSDGMGGYQYGDTASKVALSAVLAYLELRVKEDSGSFSEKTFRDAIQFANRCIFNLKKVDSTIKEMGCTLVAFLPGYQGGFAFNVGDSRCYRYRGGELAQMTKDHSLEEDLPEFMRGLGNGAYSGILSRAIGTHADVEADMYEFDLIVKDVILLCSDGLYSMVPEQEIKKILSKKETLASKCKQLIDIANLKGGQDNITVTLIQIENLDKKNQLEVIPETPE